MNPKSKIEGLVAKSVTACWKASRDVIVSIQTVTIQVATSVPRSKEAELQAPIFR